MRIYYNYYIMGMKCVVYGHSKQLWHNESSSSLHLDRLNKIVFFLIAEGNFVNCILLRINAIYSRNT